MSRLAVSMVAALALGVGQGCVVDSKDVENTPVQPGTVELSWYVGPSGCEAAGVTDIAVDIAGLTSTFACEDGAASMTVPPGTYEVELEGLDDGGSPRYSGAAHSVVVRSEQVTQTPTVTLSALAAEVEVTWYFDNGRFCSHADNKGVVEIEAVLYDSQDFAEDSLIAECDVGELLMEGVRPGEYTLTLIGRNDAGGITHLGEADLMVQKGDSLTADVELITQ